MKKLWKVALMLPLLIGCRALEVPSDEIAREPLSAAYINREVFESLELGMSIEQVNEIIGIEPSSEWLSTPEVLLQRWNNYDQPNFHVSFTSGYVTDFSYHEFPRMDHLSIEKLNLLDFQMTISEMENIIGAAPSQQGFSMSSGLKWETATWQDVDDNLIFVEKSNDDFIAISFWGSASIESSELEAFEEVTHGMKKEEALNLIASLPTYESRSIWSQGPMRSEIGWNTVSDGTFSINFVDGLVVSTDHFYRDSGSY